MKKTIKIKWILIAIGLLVAAYFPFRFLLSIKSSNLNWSKTSIPQYNELFNVVARDKFNIPTTIKNKDQEPVSSYIYDKRFDVLVYSVILSKKLSLKNIVNLRNGVSEKNNNDRAYLNMSNDEYKMYKGIDSIGYVSTLNVRFNSDSNKYVFKDDRVICYYYKLKSFSINYNDKPYDIMINSDGSGIPLSTAFIKKGNVFYVIIMTPATGEREIQQDQLYNIIR